MPRAVPSLRLSVLAAGALLSVASTPPAAAQDDEPSKLYAGVGLAALDFESDHEGIGYSATPIGWQLYGGLQARENMAVELALDRFSGIESGDILGSGVERLRISAENTSVTVRGVFSLSLQDVLRRQQNVLLFGTVGIARTIEDRDVVELTTRREISASEHDNGLVVGAGVIFDVARVRLRAHFQSLDRSGPSLDSIGLAAEFRF